MKGPDIGGLPIIDCHVHFTDMGSEGRILEIMEKTHLTKMSLLSTLDEVRLNFNLRTDLYEAYPPHLFYTFGVLE